MRVPAPAPDPGPSTSTPTAPTRKGPSSRMHPTHRIPDTRNRFQIARVRWETAASSSISSSAAAISATRSA